MAVLLWSLENKVFAQFVFYATILLLKMIIMSPLTSFQRRRKLVWINPEDAARRNVHSKIHDPDVERVRRAHRNDLENVVPFLLLGLLLVQVDACPVFASACYRLFTIARVLHTLSYLQELSYLRGLLFLVGFLINVFMGFYILSAVAFL